MNRSEDARRRSSEIVKKQTSRQNRNGPSQYNYIFVPASSCRHTPLRDSNTSADELALTSSSYPVEEPKSSADELVFTSFSRLVEDDISADELDHTTYVKPIVSDGGIVSRVVDPFLIYTRVHTL